MPVLKIRKKTSTLFNCIILQKRGGSYEHLFFFLPAAHANYEGLTGLNSTAFVTDKPTAAL